MALHAMSHKHETPHRTLRVAGEDDKPTTRKAADLMLFYKITLIYIAIAVTGILVLMALA